MTRVALNLLYLDPGKTGGMETVARQLLPALLEALPTDWELVSLLNRNAAADPTGPWHAAQTQLIDVDVASRPAWVRAELVAVSRAATALSADVLHSFGNMGPWRSPVPHLLTVNDLIHHRARPAGLALKSRITGALVVGGAKRATRVAVSATQTAIDLTQLTSVPRSRIDVIPYGIEPPTAEPVPEGVLRERLGLSDRPLILSPSARQPHKNLERLLQAQALIDPGDRPLLVLPGYATGQDEALVALTHELGITADVRWLGWVTQPELEGLYAYSRLLVFPSLYEGFGLPVLEAMMRGLPVACSSGGSLAEIAGDAALIFDPLRPEAIATAMRRLLTDDALRDNLVAAGRDHVRAFTWEACAAGYVQSLQRTLDA